MAFGTNGAPTPAPAPAPPSPTPSPRSPSSPSLRPALASTEENTIAAMAGVATAGAGVTFSVILKPAVEGSASVLAATTMVAYANALFIAVMMGCAAMRVVADTTKAIRGGGGGSEKKEEEKGVAAAAGIGGVGTGAVTSISLGTESEELHNPTLDQLGVMVGVLLVAAIFLVLVAVKLYLGISGPFIVGAVFQAIFGGYILFLLYWKYIMNSLKSIERRRGERRTQRGNDEDRQRCGR